MSEVIILDGGFSRELISLNAPFRQPEWSALSLIEAPQFVSTVHKQFLDAGADVITTNSYAIVPFHLGEDRFWRDASSLAKLAGRLAYDAKEGMRKTGRDVRVAGCLPPIFGSYEPDKFRKDQVMKYLEVLVNALAPYVDIWLAETLSLIAEAEAAFVATKETKKPFWVAFTPDDGPGSNEKLPRLRSGESIADAANWANDGRVEALLFNCARPEYMDGVLEAVRTSSAWTGSRKPPLLGVYANTFIPRSSDYSANSDVCATDQNLDPGVYKDFASRWRAVGADIVGGCCGVGHEHIEVLHKAFKNKTA